MLRLYKQSRICSAAVEPQHAAALHTTNHRHSLDELRLIRHAVDAGRYTTRTVYHDDNGMGFNPVLLRHLQSRGGSIIGTYDSQASLELLSQPINDRRCLRSGDSAVGIDKQKRRAGQRRRSSDTTTHQKTGSK
jgi:hypothetical protein